MQINNRLVHKFILLKGEQGILQLCKILIYITCYKICQAFYSAKEGFISHYTLLTCFVFYFYSGNLFYLNSGKPKFPCVDFIAQETKFCNSLIKLLLVDEKLSSHDISFYENHSVLARFSRWHVIVLKAFNTVFDSIFWSSLFKFSKVFLE